MFGYVRPLKGELRVREFEQFKSVYCGLCHTLKSRYGFAARYILNYDFTFLAMLLDCREGTPVYRYKRCIASPFKKKCLCASTPAMELAADQSMILAYWKMRDNVADSGFWKSAAFRGLSFVFRRHYRRAASRCPQFDSTVRGRLARLSALEAEGCPSLDETADNFAEILAASADNIEDTAQRRPVREILYHTGRWIYILDACHDLEEDIAASRYNPLVGRFSITGRGLSEGDRAYLETTLMHSANMAASAFELIKAGPWGEILENIICLGMPWVAGSVFEGTWGKRKV